MNPKSILKFPNLTSKSFRFKSIIRRASRLIEADCGGCVHFVMLHVYICDRFDSMTTQQQKS